MRLRLTVVLTSAFVLLIGIVTLLGLLIGNDFGDLSTLVNNTPLRVLAELFLRLAVMVLALTVLIGVLNLFTVNVTRLLRGRTLMARLGSLVVVITFLGAVFIRLLDSVNNTNNSAFLLSLQVVIESSLGGLLFVALVWGAFNMLNRELTWGRVLFVATLLTVLLGALPVRGVGILYELNLWLMSVPVTAGARGILLGIALATVVTGLRVLIGQDRQYGE
jgi:hypothetical protein